MDLARFLPYTAPTETFSVCGAQQDLHPGSRRLKPNPYLLLLLWEGQRWPCVCVTVRHTGENQYV